MQVALSSPRSRETTSFLRKIRQSVDLDAFARTANDPSVHTFVLRTEKKGPVRGIAQVTVQPNRFVLSTLEMDAGTESVAWRMLARVLMALKGRYKGRGALIANCGDSEAKRRLIGSCGKFRKVEGNIYRWWLTSSDPAGEKMGVREAVVAGTEATFVARYPSTRALAGRGAAWLYKDWKDAAGLVLRSPPHGYETVPLLRFTTTLVNEGDFSLRPTRRFLSMKLRVVGHNELRDIELTVHSEDAFLEAWNSMFGPEGAFPLRDVLGTLTDIAAHEETVVAAGVSSARLEDATIVEQGVAWFVDYVDQRPALFAYLLDGSGKMVAVLPNILVDELGRKDGEFTVETAVGDFAIDMEDSALRKVTDMVESVQS